MAEVHAHVFIKSSDSVLFTFQNFRTDSQGNSFEAVSGSHEALSVLRVEANGGNIILRANRDEPNGKDGVVVEGSPDTTDTYIHSHIHKKYFD